MFREEAIAFYEADIGKEKATSYNQEAALTHTSTFFRHFYRNSVVLPPLSS